MGVRKLRTVFMKYAIFLALGVFLVAFVNIAFYLFGVEIGFIYPINRMSAEIENARGSLQSTDRITENEIPPLCEYALFTKDGKYIGGSLDQEEPASVWKMCIVNNQTSSKPYLYAVIDRTDEILILRYRMTAQFSNPLLHRIFPSADWVLIAVIILEILLFLIVLSYLFGKYLGNKMDKLLTAVKKIEQQDLNFEVEKSHLYEIDLTLDALNHMKLALKKSLTEQWQADKLRQEQISALAHDLKTPLTIIRGNTELLYDTDLTIEQQECADYITDSYTQMQVYVKTLIDLSTASTGYQLNKEIFNLPDYLKQVKVSIDALCRTKEIHLRMSMSDIPMQLTADKVLLGRAIQNVVNNALDYSPQDGTLHIDVCGKDNFVEISVTDEGEGFSNEALQHAQEQFAYTGPRAPSARRISPTLPERSPTIPRAVLEERPCQPRRRAEPGISDRSRGWGCRWQSKQSPVIECDSGKSVIPPAWHRRFPRIPVPLHAGSSNPIQGHRGNRRD